MASFNEEYSYRKSPESFGHKVCKVTDKNLTDEQKAYMEKLIDLMLDDLLRSPEAFSA